LQPLSALPSDDQNQRRAICSFLLDGEGSTALNERFIDDFQALIRSDHDLPAARADVDMIRQPPRAGSGAQLY
jgi:hypothetical protein